MIELRIKSEPDNIAMVCQCARALAIQAGTSEDCASSIELAVSEAVTNSIEHAYQWETDREVIVYIDFYYNCMHIEVNDNGLPLPAGNLDTDTDSISTDDALMAESGRGLAIMTALVDQIVAKQENGWNKLLMSKTLK